MVNLWINSPLGWQFILRVSAGTRDPGWIEVNWSDSVSGFTHKEQFLITHNILFDHSTTQSANSALFKVRLPTIGEVS